MDLVSLKHWQWAIIGVFVGTLIGFSWMGFPAEVPRSADANDFKRELGVVSSGNPFPATKDRPRIINIVVMPPEEDNDGKLVYPVTYDRLGVNAKDELVYRAEGLYARTPFDRQDSIVDYLKRREIAFSDRTGAGKYRPVAYGAAIGLLAVGFVWPTLINLMVGAGIAKPKPREEKKAYATGTQNDGTIKDKKHGVNAKDVADLNALNDKLEASVAKGLKSGGSRVQASEVDEIVSKLMSSGSAQNTSDPTATPVTTQNDEPKDYKGEWYPVARPKAHKDDAK